MTVLSGKTLQRYEEEGRGIISPFSLRTTAFGMSYGLSYAGYDIRIREKLTLPYGAFKLASSLEEFTMPPDVIGFVHDKSTWARRGLSLFNTVIEPGWRGFLTLELVNHSNILFIEEGMPIAQIVFKYVDQDVPEYNGKYQDQPPCPVGAIDERDNVISLHQHRKQYAV